MSATQLFISAKQENYLLIFWVNFWRKRMQWDIKMGIGILSGQIRWSRHLSCNFVFLKLKSHDAAVVFHKYHDFSINYSARADTGKLSSSFVHFLSASSPCCVKFRSSSKNHWRIDTQGCYKQLCESTSYH